ncbi:hypothetical protein [Streptomyces sp. CS62]|uniref:hypothetical protein n=1 Tax=Streptomyces sp. CS62 TaxID=3119268 RepID=UPI002F95DD9C
MHFDRQERILMTGGRGRSVAPRELATDPENWPDAVIPNHPQARVVQAIARSLARHVNQERVSVSAASLHSAE